MTKLYDAMVLIAKEPEFAEDGRRNLDIVREALDLVEKIWRLVSIEEFVREGRALKAEEEKQWKRLKGSSSKALFNFALRELLSITQAKFLCKRLFRVLLKSFLSSPSTRSSPSSPKNVRLFEKLHTQKHRRLHPGDPE